MERDITKVTLVYDTVRINVGGKLDDEKLEWIKKKLIEYFSEGIKKAYAEVLAAQSAKQKPVAVEEETFLHYVAPDEWLSHIAAKYGTTVEKLAELNNLESINFIRAGSALKVPGAAENTQPYKVRKASSEGNYTVLKDEDLSTLAVKFNTTVAELAKMNSIDAQNLNNIYEGERLSVPIPEGHTREEGPLGPWPNGVVLGNNDGENGNGSINPSSQKSYKESNNKLLEKVIKNLPPETAEIVREIIAKDIDLSRVAIGIENSIELNVSIHGKTEVNFISGKIMFLGGDDAGYVYEYVTPEAGAGVSSNIEGSINRGMNFFVAYQHNPKGSKKDFAGEYTYGRVAINADLKKIGIPFSVGNSYSVSRGDSWTVLSKGSSIGFGEGRYDVSGSITGGKGEVIFIEEPAPKGFWETIGSLPLLLTPYPLSVIKKIK